MTALSYAARWNSTDQVPDRAIAAGLIPRFGNLDATDGGTTARHSLVGDFQHTSAAAVTRATAFVSRYRLNLFSNFTYALDDPVRGDQFEQADRRWVIGRAAVARAEDSLGKQARRGDRRHPAPA